MGGAGTLKQGQGNKACKYKWAIETTESPKGKKKNNHTLQTQKPSSVHSVCGLATVKVM